MTGRRGHLLLLAPYLLGLGVLVILPAAITFGLALTEYDLIRSPTFVHEPSIARWARMRAAYQRALSLGVRTCVS